MTPFICWKKCYHIKFLTLVQ